MPGIRFFTLIFAIIVILSGSAFAQGDYLPYGTDGYQVFGGASGNTDVSGFLVGYGYSSGGVIDCGLSLGLGNYRSSTICIFTPAVVFYPLKQGRFNMPVSLALGLKGQLNQYIGENSETSSEFYYSFGGWLLRNFRISSSFLIQPSVGFSHIKGQDVEDYEEDTFGDAGLSFFMENLNKNLIFKIDFGVSAGKEITNYTFAVGVVVNPEKNKRVSKRRW